MSDYVGFLTGKYWNYKIYSQSIAIILGMNGTVTVYR